VLLPVALSIPGLGRWCIFSPDSFQYLEMARSVAETGGFPHRHFMLPPGFPVVLAPLLCFGSLPLLPMRTLLAACWAIAAALTYLLHRDELGRRLAWVAGLLVAISPVLLHSTMMLLSEPVFTVLALMTLLVMVRWWRRPVGSVWFVALGGLLTAAAVMVRSVGIVLLPVLALALLRHRDQPVTRRAIGAGILACCVLGPLAAWHIRQGLYPTGIGYEHIWTAARAAEKTDATGLALQLERFQKFAPSRLDSIKETMLPKDLAWRAFNPPWDQPTTWLIGGFFVVVALVRLIRLRSPVDLYVLLTLLILSLWPWDEGVRLVAPLILIFVSYPLWVGLLIWRRARGRTWARPAVAVALVLWLLLQAAGVTVELSRLPTLKAKARHRMDVMATLAAWHDAYTSPGATWIGVTPQADDSKTLLLGAAYLSRRPVTTIDVRDQSAYDLDLSVGQRAFVHEALANSVKEKHGYVPVSRQSGFVVFERPGL